MAISKEAALLSIKITVPTACKNAFAEWKAELNASIIAFPGFVSLEVLSPVSSETGDLEWVIILRFSKKERMLAWRSSVAHQNLIDDLQLTVLKGSGKVDEIELEGDVLQAGVTEVFITEISQDKTPAFRKWIAKIHQVEARFPGFKGVYIQSPSESQGKNWIVFLQFDTPENLDRWLASSERRQVLKEAQPLIAALESHRVISPYAGWFSSFAENGKEPAPWKQTMLVLLVLFPIIMSERKYLAPLIDILGSSLTVFIGNLMSVLLISWPLMPLVIRLLRWWLSPEKETVVKTVMGTCLILVLYLLEVLLFWDFF